MGAEPQSSIPCATGHMMRAHRRPERHRTRLHVSLLPHVRLTCPSLPPLSAPPSPVPHCPYLPPPHLSCGSGLYRRWWRPLRRRSGTSRRPDHILDSEPGWESEADVWDNGGLRPQSAGSPPRCRLEQRSIGSTWHNQSTFEIRDLFLYYLLRR